MLIVIFFFGSTQQKKTIFGLIATNITAFKADKIIAISKAVKNYFISGQFGINNKKLNISIMVWIT